MTDREVEVKPWKVDWDRAKLAEQEGYQVNLYSMEPYSCTPKNNFLLGIKILSH